MSNKRIIALSEKVTLDSGDFFAIDNPSGGTKKHQAKKILDPIAKNAEDIADLKDDFNNVTNTTELTFTKGKYINTNVATGSVVNTTPQSSGAFAYTMVECKPGDIFYVWGSSAAGARLWCFTDAEYKSLGISSDTKVMNGDKVIAPMNAKYFIGNSRVAYGNYRVVQETFEQQLVFTEDYYINNSTSPVTFQRIYGTSFAHAYCECKPGDIFYISGKGASTAKLWCFADADKNIIQFSGNDITLNNGEVVAPYNSAYLIVNTYKNYGAYKVIKSGNNAIVCESLVFTGTLTITSNQDLNNYTTAGNYRINTGSIASTITNIPVAVAGRLTVTTINAAASIEQKYRASNGRTFWRTYTGGAWTAWKELPYLNWIKSNTVLTNGAEATRITSGSNLDTYRTAGNYFVESIAVAQNVSNIPEVSSGRLMVLVLYGTAAVHQIFIAASNNWYVRELISDVWSAWKHFVDSDDVDPYKELSESNENAAKGAYNALQAIIANTSYNMAFANAFVPLALKNYIGNTQNVHPKVLYFPNGFGGHSYWMAYTPYPYSRDGYENPCIAYSDDGISWTNISGNPLDDPNGNGYNSDTHLVYREDTGTLECWYRYIGPATQSQREETIYRQTTTDGITWTAKEIVYSNTSGQYAQLLSPAVIVENSKYCIWVVNSDNGSTVDYYEAPVSNVTAWTKVRSISFSITDSGIAVKPWHIDLIKDGSTYIMLIMCRNGTQINNNICSLFIATSSNNTTYGTPVKVVGGADNWDKYMYRSSIVKIGNKYRIYYSASGGGTTSIYNNAVWGIGITESDTLTNGYIGKYE